MGRTGNGTGKEPNRITLRNYLDMSRSLNLEPSSSHNVKKKWDMTKSMNAEPGFFARTRIDLGQVNSSLTVVARSPKAPTVSKPCKVTAVSSKAAKTPHHFPTRSSFHTGFNNKTLPRSPNVCDSPQEKELIDDFVDQLKTIASSSSSSNTTTRRVVRKALEFSTNLTMARASVSEPCNEQQHIHKSKREVVVVGNTRRHLNHRHLLPVAEEKQTVISSPIAYTNSSSMSRPKLKSVDMAPAVQQHAIELALQLLNTMDKLNCKLVAWQLKKEFDKVYGPAWHCIVGTSFGSYVTHSVGGFIYFAVGKVSILLFRTAIEVVDKK